jgi:D-lyxose ketol-isomerase
MNRRDCLTTMVSSAAVLTAAFSGAAFAAERPMRSAQFNRLVRRGKMDVLIKYPNAHFYNDGKFDVKTATAAYTELFKFHNYSLADVVNDKRFWAVDFGLGDFANVGMGGIFWLNDKEHGCFGHEIYLLPGQMIPEHSHVPAEGSNAKHEYWQVRHGSIWTFSEGGSKDEKQAVQLPKSQLEAGAITCFKSQELKVGGEAALSGLGDWHFMIAGSEGAIITEYGSFHAMKGLKFQNKKAAL